MRVFYGTQARRRIIQKGGQVGMTQGAAQYAVEMLLDGVGPILWGDTTHGNCKAYFRKYMRPLLEQISPEGKLWSMNWSGGVFTVNGQELHFRAAQNPENWEGFNYRIIILNEAGIILHNPYLWEQAVAKMLLRYDDSILIAAGVPKGRNTFVTLIEKGNDPVANPGWETIRLTTYDNPFISLKAIEQMEKDLPAHIVRQEIYGDIVDGDDDARQLIPGGWIDSAMELHDSFLEIGEVGRLSAIGIDVAREGVDRSVIFPRWNARLEGERDWKPVRLGCTTQERAHRSYGSSDGLVTGPALAAKVMDLLRGWVRIGLAQERGVSQSMVTDAQVRDEMTKVPVRLDAVGIGVSLLDSLRQLHPKPDCIIAMKGAEKAYGKDRTGTYHFANAKTKWWWQCREGLDPITGRGWQIPKIQGLRSQLSAPRFDVVKQDLLQIERQDKIRQRLGRSPDEAVALINAISDVSGGGVTVASW
jgi:hypothetical protein